MTYFISLTGYQFRIVVMGICKSRIKRSENCVAVVTAKQRWKWAVKRICDLLKLRKRWAHISRTILQKPLYLDLFKGLERKQGKLIRK